MRSRALWANASSCFRCEDFPLLNAGLGPEFQAVDLSTIRHLAPRASARKSVFSFEKIDPHSILLVSPWSMPVFSASSAWVSRFSRRLGHSSCTRW